MKQIDLFHIPDCMDMSCTSVETIYSSILIWFPFLQNFWAIDCTACVCASDRTSFKLHTWTILASKISHFARLVKVKVKIPCRCTYRDIRPRTRSLTHRHNVKVLTTVRASCYSYHFILIVCVYAFPQSGVCIVFNFVINILRIGLIFCAKLARSGTVLNS